jgi:hypothetical protein
MNFYSAKEPAISLLEGSVAQVLADFHIDWQIQPEDGKKNVNDTLARLG